jgi:L-alanine-DL-glutamate epimerase-like enolase superfamily enzyme
MWVPKLLGRRGLTTRAISAIDIGLWDIRAKVAGLPLYKLLATGAEPQTRIRAYASGGEFTWCKGSRFPGPEDMIKMAADVMLPVKNGGKNGVSYTIYEG